MDQIRLKKEDVEGLTWEPVEVTEDFILSRAVFGTNPDGTPVYAYQKAPRGSQEFLEGLAQERNANEGRRWSTGLGSDKGGNMPMMKVGSIPTNVLFRDFQGRFGDRDFKKWWWQQEDNQVFRSRTGNI